MPWPAGICGREADPSFGPVEYYTKYELLAAASWLMGPEETAQLQLPPSESGCKHEDSLLVCHKS